MTTVTPQAAAPPAPPDQRANTASATLQGTVAECLLPGTPAAAKPFFTLDLIEDGEGGHLLCLNVDDAVGLDTAEHTRAVAVQAARLSAALAAYADLQQLIRDNRLRLVTLNPATAPDEFDGLLCLLYDDTDGVTTLVLPKGLDPRVAVPAVRDALADHQRRQA